MNVNLSSSDGVFHIVHVVFVIHGRTLPSYDGLGHLNRALGIQIVGSEAVEAISKQIACCFLFGFAGCDRLEECALHRVSPYQTFADIQDTELAAG